MNDSIVSRLHVYNITFNSMSNQPSLHVVPNEGARSESGKRRRDMREENKRRAFSCFSFVSLGANS